MRENPFRDYTSIADVFKDHADTLQKQLNGVPFYVELVESMGYERIGIEVYATGDWNTRIGTYVSHNGTDGRIERIENSYDRDPDISVRVQEATLMKILKNMDSLKQHPLDAFFSYAGRFRPSSNHILNYAKLVKIIPTVARHLLSPVGK